MFKKGFNIIIALCVIVILISSCKKEGAEAPVPNPSAILNINSIYQANFTLDGTQKSYVYGNGNFHSNFGGWDHTPIDTLDYFIYSSAIGDTAGVGVTIKLGPIKALMGYRPDYSDFATLYSSDTVSYISLLSRRSVIVEYRDGTKLWDSSYGNQIGSNFKIVETQVDTLLSGTTIYLKTHMTFNCKLYDADGNVKILTNGLFIGSFWQY